MVNVITVENLSKKYMIAHQRPERYTALRDVLTNGIKRIGRKVLTPFSWAKQSSLAREEFWALKDVSFDIKRGEAIGIIGRNGAGKTTLLKVLSRITEPSAGRVVIKGRVASLLEVGTGFHPELTGRENIYLNGAILGMTHLEIKRKFDEIVAFAEVDKFLDTPAKRYSSGMYVRLAFAVAAHLEPEILLVDEVLAVGDVAFQKKCLGKMGNVAREGRTVLFVSHNMAAIQNLCKWGLVLQNGSIEYLGDVGEAVEKYLSSTASHNYGFADLSEHPGRPPHMPVMIKSIAIHSDGDSAGHCSSVKTGDDVTIEIQYDCGDTSVDYAVIGVNSPLGERVFTIGTHLYPGFDKVIRGKGILKCRIPHLTLAEGEYSVLVAMGRRIPPLNVDEVIDALRFRVEFGDYFGTAATPLRGQGYLAQRSYWSVEA